MVRGRKFRIRKFLAHSLGAVHHVNLTEMMLRLLVLLYKYLYICACAYTGFLFLFIRFLATGKDGLLDTFASIFEFLWGHGGVTADFQARDDW